MHAMPMMRLRGRAAPITLARRSRARDAPLSQAADGLHFRRRGGLMQISANI